MTQVLMEPCDVVHGRVPNLQPQGCVLPDWIIIRLVPVLLLAVGVLRLLGVLACHDSVGLQDTLCLVSQHQLSKLGGKFRGVILGKTAPESKTWHTALDGHMVVLSSACPSKAITHPLLGREATRWLLCGLADAEDVGKLQAILAHVDFRRVARKPAERSCHPGTASP